MQSSGIAPDVVDAVPKNTIKIIYPSRVTVERGNELTPTEVKDQPKISWAAENGSLYLLAMIDPDVPSRQDRSVGECIHYMVGNVPGDDLAKGDVLFEYIGAGAPEGSGLHRYVWLLYKQPGSIDFGQDVVTKRSVKNRLKFSIRKFALEKSLGQPIAGNFFVAQYDDYVPVLHKQLSEQ